MNKIILIGNLTKDVKLNTTTSGVSVGKFTLAVSRRFQNADGEREVDFINIVVWKKLAETCHKHLKKGNRVGVSGSLQTRSYEAQDGTKRYATEVVVDEISFLTPKSPSEEPENIGMQPINDDNLPF